MCSIGEDDFGDQGGQHAMFPEKSTDFEELESECEKCGRREKVYKLPFRQPECRDCFLIYVRHKFRAVLGASKALPRNASVLVAFNGSAEGLVLLDMLCHAEAENTYKRLHCSVRVLYVDESDGVTTKSYEEHLKDLKALMATYENAEAFITPLGTSNDARPYGISELEQYLQRDRCAEELFWRSVRIVETPTSRQEFVNVHRKRRLMAAAKQLNCQFVFMPEICTKLAVDLLSAFALGRGGSAALDVALIDDRLGGENVKLMRPLKDLSEEEIKLYLRARELTPLIAKVAEEQSCENSLQHITRAFVRGLQENYASTVSTVYRTGNKIAPNRELEERLSAFKLNGTESLPTCGFCDSALDAVDSATLLAVRFSRFVSKKGSVAANGHGLWDIENGAAEKNIHLCHACGNIQRDYEGNLL